MIEFHKESSSLLPYNRNEYFDFMDDVIDRKTNWNGVSLQIAERTAKLDERSILIYEEIFTKIVLKIDESQPWILNHYYKDLIWFPNSDDNLNLFRRMFRINNIPNTFKGAIVLMKEDMLRLSRDIITYPFILSYRDIDISHNRLPIIIKITNHFTIDLISTDKILLNRILNDESLKKIHIKYYK